MKKVFNILTYIGLIAIAAAMVIPLFTGPANIVYKIIFSVGAGLTLIGRIFTRYDGPSDLRVRRLVRIQTWSALFFCAAAFFMWYSASPTDWLAFTLAGALIQCYVSITLPRAMKRAANAESSAKPRRR